MAHRLSYLKFIRKTHFVASLIVLIMMLMYAFSGFVMTRFSWFPKAKVDFDTSFYALNYKPDTTNLEKLSKQIKIQFDVSGRKEFRRNNDGSISFQFSRPGYYCSVLMQNELDSVRIVRRKNASFMRLINVYIAYTDFQEA
ncbi:MAG: hypothetical protein HC906_08750 [Bacteroidales bacterium]|nr:hypothetical protein [Bacteroidales bacterium]